MATNVTKSTLLGSGATMNLESDGNIVDQQTTSPPGGEGVIVASLGSKGRQIVFQCSMRGTGASLSAALTSLNALKSSLRTRESSKEELNLFASDSTFPGALHTGDMDGVVIEGISFGVIEKSVKGSTYAIIQQLRIVFRKLL